MSSPIHAGLMIVLACGGHTAGQDTRVREAASRAPAAPQASDMADYEPIPLARLIATTTLAVIGRVAAEESSTVTLAVEAPLLGNSPGSLTMTKFFPSKFDEPRTPYGVGQRFAVFLERPAPDAEWRVRGLGGEGEMPVEDGHVYFHGRFVEGLPRTRHRVHGAERDIQRYELRPFIDAITRLGRCFTWHQDEDRGWYTREICGKAELESYRRSSTLHGILVTESLKSLR